MVLWWFKIYDQITSQFGWVWKNEKSEKVIKQLMTSRKRQAQKVREILHDSVYE